METWYVLAGHAEHASLPSALMRCPLLHLGASVGLPVGADVGAVEGAAVGLAVGDDDGLAVGLAVGVAVVGVAVGLDVKTHVCILCAAEQPLVHM